MRNILKNKTFPREFDTQRKRTARTANSAHVVCVKRITAFAVCLLLVLSNFITAFADGVQSNNRTIRAGIFSFDGYHMKDEEGRLTGYGIEFLSLVSQYSRLNFQYTGYDRAWGKCLICWKTAKSTW